MGDNSTEKRLKVVEHNLALLKKAEWWIKLAGRNNEIYQAPIFFLGLIMAWYWQRQVIPHD